MLAPEMLTYVWYAPLSCATQALNSPPENPFSKYDKKETLLQEPLFFVLMRSLIPRRLRV